MSSNLHRRGLLAAGLLALFGHNPIASPTFAATAEAATAEARHVTRLMNDLIALGNIGQRDKLIKRIASVLRRRADTSSISLFALGSYRRQLPKALQSDYINAAINYSAATFANYVSDFEGAKFKLNATNASGKQVIVIGDVAYASGKVHQVRFKIAGGPSRPRIADVNVQGLWLALQLRKMFTDELKRNRGNFKLLIEWLNWQSK